jgi:hypothetical protein
MIRKTLLTVLAVLVIATTGQAIPLRELIAQQMDQEHAGVLTSVEIRNGRVVGAHWYHQHPMGMIDLEPRAKAVAHRLFPHDAAKQWEYALEIAIGFWNPES